MTDQNQQSPAPAETAVPPAETPTLEQIAKELSVEEQAQQFTSSVQTYQPQFVPPFQQAQQAPQVPDPVMDPQGYAAHMARQAQALSQLDTTVQGVNSRLQTWERQQVEQKINRDVESAVSKVNQKLNLDPLVTEALLEATYKKDANFRRIWDNRDRNPQALDKALEVLTGKFSGQFQAKQDPQIAKNLQAAKASQQTMATTQRNQNDEVPTDPSEFDRWWSQKISRGF